LTNIEAKLNTSVTSPKKVRDISLTGIYIEGLSSVDVNQKYRVQLTGWRKGVVQFLSRVVRVDGSGAGLEFLDLDYDACELLRTMMLYFAKDPLQTARLFQEPCAHA